MVVAPIEFAVYLSLFMGMAWHMVAQACEAACLLFKAFDAFAGKGFKGKVYMRLLRQLFRKVTAVSDFD